MCCMASMLKGPHVADDKILRLDERDVVDPTEYSYESAVINVRDQNSQEVR